MASTTCGRLAGFAVAALLVSLPAGQGPCLMGTAPAAASPAQPHDCCKSGLRNVMPGCCWSGVGADSPARPTVPQRGTAPLPVQLLQPELADPVLPFAHAAGWADPASASHSPPPKFTVLRI